METDYSPPGYQPEIFMMEASSPMPNGSSSPQQSDSGVYLSLGTSTAKQQPLVVDIPPYSTFSRTTNSSNEFHSTPQLNTSYPTTNGHRHSFDPTHLRKLNGHHHLTSGQQQQHYFSGYRPNRRTYPCDNSGDDPSTFQRPHWPPNTFQQHTVPPMTNSSYLRSSPAWRNQLILRGHSNSSGLGGMSHSISSNLSSTTDSPSGLLSISSANLGILDEPASSISSSNEQGLVSSSSHHHPSQMHLLQTPHSSGTHHGHDSSDVDSSPPTGPSTNSLKPSSISPSQFSNCSSNFAAAVVKNPSSTDHFMCAPLPIDPSNSGFTPSFGGAIDPLEPCVRERANTWHGGSQTQQTNGHILESLLEDDKEMSGNEDEDSSDPAYLMSAASSARTYHHHNQQMSSGGGFNPNSSSQHSNLLPLTSATPYGGAFGGNGTSINKQHIGGPIVAPSTCSSGMVSPSACSVTSGDPNGSSEKTSRKNAWGNHSYADLITQAIESSTDQRLTLSQIYEWMVKSVPYFRDKGDSTSSAGWKNSIRHNLSLHTRFMRVQNDSSGKSSWWIINPDASKHNKTPRRRANTIDVKTAMSGSISEKKTRGRMRKRLGTTSGGISSPVSRTGDSSTASSTGGKTTPSMKKSSGSNPALNSPPGASTTTPGAPRSADLLCLDTMASLDMRRTPTTQSFGSRPFVTPGSFMTSPPPGQASPFGQNFSPAFGRPPYHHMQPQFASPGSTQLSPNYTALRPAVSSGAPQRMAADSTSDGGKCYSSLQPVNLHPSMPPHHLSQLHSANLLAGLSRLKTEQHPQSSTIVHTSNGSTLYPHHQSFQSQQQQQHNSLASMLMATGMTPPGNPGATPVPFACSGESTNNNAVPSDLDMCLDSSYGQSGSLFENMDTTNMDQLMTQEVNSLVSLAGGNLDSVNFDSIIPPAN